MKYKPTILASVFMIFLAGCDTQLDPTKKDGSGTLRHELYKECMEYALRFDKNVGTLSLEDAEYGDGIAEIISECRSSAYYMANMISSDG